MPVQIPFVTPFVSIRDFGAVPDHPSPAVRLANTNAFKQAQAAMQSPGQAWGHPLFVPSGTFYLADDLRIFKQLQLFGTGIQGESVLMFSGGTSLIIDGGDGANPTLDGSDCVIRDLQIISEENWTTDEIAPFDADNFDPRTFESTSNGTPGIRMGTSATIQRVYIKGFTGTGIHVKKTRATNVNLWRIHDVYINSCGGHGIHVGGRGLEPGTGQSETQGGLCTGAKILVVGGSGIYENSFGGNTYVGCYVEVAKGRGYASDSGGQTTFVGCFSEANELNRLRAGGNVWVGGSSAGFTDDTTAFIAEGYGNVHPFAVPNGKDDKIRLLVGYPNDGTDPTTVCAWATNNGEGGAVEFYVMRWDVDNKVWTTENGGVLPEVDVADGKFLKLAKLADRQIANYLTGNGHPRGPWLQGFGEMLLGPPDSPIKISRGAQPDAGTGEPGDIVYNADPDVGDFIGYVCLGPTRVWKPFGKIET